MIKVQNEQFDFLLFPLLFPFQARGLVTCGLAFFIKCFYNKEKQLTNGDQLMENRIISQQFDEERALYHLTDAVVEGCRFEGPADGESALKEARNITVKNCQFSLRYPLWHVEGFTLTGCDGKLNYVQPPLACYGLYADYYWYEISDVICIGNKDALYYCFPKGATPVARTRLAAEELYKLKKVRRTPASV
jgi:hypothetical protein